MKLNKKGFTLVELLAVIVVLAIIALIGYTVVGDVITTSQTKADRTSIGEFAKALSNTVLMDRVQDDKGLSVSEIGTVTTSTAVNSTADTKLGQNIYTGEEIKCKTITVEDGGTVELVGCTVNGRQPAEGRYWGYAAGAVTDTGTAGPTA